MTKFSIFIPIIKTKFLDDAIESVLRQTFSDWKLFLFNDCSPENVDEVVKKYLTDRRVRYKKGDANFGAADPSKAWNKLLELADGQYVCLLGDDDVLAKNFLEEMDKLTSRYPENNVFRAKLKRIDEEGKEICANSNLPEIESCIVSMYERLVNKRLQSTSEFIIRREALQNIGGYVSFPRACGSDDATYLLLSKEKGIVSSNKTFASWRKSSLNISDNDGEELDRRKLKRLVLWEKNFLDDCFSSEIPPSKLYFALHDLLRYAEASQRSENKYPFSLSSLQKNFKKYLNKFLSSSLRQPVRKVWYAARGKKLKK